jgi:acyl carrier protein
MTTEPNSRTAQVLLEVWQEVLRDDTLHEHSDFLAVGGTSLTAVRIRGYIREELGKDVPIEEILRNPSPHAIAAAVVAAPDWDEDW